MPSYIIKPSEDEDFYVTYSTVVDSPTAFGNREDYVVAGTEEDRLVRADEYGTSSLWGNPRYLGWHEDTIMVREGIIDPTRPEHWSHGTLSRSDLREFCETLEDDGEFHPPPGMVQWELFEDG